MFIAIANILIVILITNNSTTALFFQLIFLKSFSTPIQPTCGHQIHFNEISLLCLFFIQMLFVKAQPRPQCPNFLSWHSRSPEGRLTTLSSVALVHEPYLGSLGSFLSQQCAMFISAIASLCMPLLLSENPLDSQSKS